MSSVECFYNGEYCPVESAKLPISDIGFIHGVTVTEQLRTMNGKLFLLAEHLHRFNEGLKRLDIKLDVSDEKLVNVAHELTSRYLKKSQQSDCGLGIFATPGVTDRYGQAPRGPQYCLYCYPLPEQELKNPFGREFKLKISQTQDVDSASWPKNIKVRSRLHYYLADLEFKDTPYTAILVDQNGYIRDTSISSPLFFFQPSELTLPPVEDILNSVSLGFAIHLAKQLNFRIERRAVHRSEVENLEAMGLVNSLFCMATVSEFEGKKLDTDSQELNRMIELWKTEAFVVTQ